LRLLAVFLVGLSVGVGGTVGVQAVTDESDFRSEAVWKDVYRQCLNPGGLDGEIQNYFGDGPSPQACRREADRRTGR
jgi:hypothetical protein